MQYMKNETNEASCTKGWRFQVNSKQTWNCAKSVGWEDWDRIVPSNVGHLPEKKFQAIWLALR